MTDRHGTYELRVYSETNRMEHSIRSDNLAALNAQADRLVAHWRTNGVRARVEVGRVLTLEEAREASKSLELEA